MQSSARKHLIIVFALVLTWAVNFSHTVIWAQSSQPQPGSTPEGSASTTAPATRPATGAPVSQPDQTFSILDRVAEVTADHIAQTHGAPRWRQRTAVQVDVVATWDDQPSVAGTMLIEINRDRVRIDLKNGTTIIRDGEKAWMSSAGAPIAQSPLHPIHWSFFFTAPFELKEAKTKAFQTRQLQDKRFGTFQLNFEDSSVERTADRYVCYTDAKVLRLHALAIVEPNPTTTVASSESPDPARTAEAEFTPLVLVYDNYQTVEGAQLATTWAFWNWSQEQGAHGEPVGKATISNIKFIKPDDGAFVPVDGSRELESN